MSPPTAVAGDGLRMRAHAKVNLALRVGRRGDDGYHPVATVLQTISLADRLLVRPLTRAPAAGAPVRLLTHGASLPEDNTVVRAVALLADGVARAAVGQPGPVEVRLWKRIPLGAGLGGGSSDAAAALVGCSRLWCREADPRRLAALLLEVAARVGADVPFFLLGGTGLGTGRGDRVRPLTEIPAQWLVVAAPPLELSTAVAYAAFDEDRGAAAPGRVPVPPYSGVLEEGWMGNDLAAPVAARFPEVERARRALRQTGAGIAQLTGGGAASFGTYAGRRPAAEAARRLRARGYWARACRTVSRRQHARALDPSGRLIEALGGPPI